MLLKSKCDTKIEVTRKFPVLNPNTLTVEEQTVVEEFTCNRYIAITKTFYNNEDPDLATKAYHMLECGHFLVEELNVTVKDDASRHPILWNRLLPYQKKSVRFLEKNNGRALLAHDVGLGKTVITLSYIRENQEKLTDKVCLIVTQAGDIYRWQEEALEWFGHKDMMIDNLETVIRMFPTVYHTSGTRISPGSNVIISSWTRLGEDNFIDQIKDRGISCIVLDESHMYKNKNSKRTRNLQNLVAYADDRNGYATPVVSLTATPITNRLSEYTTTLNIIDPRTFPNDRAVLSWCDYDYVTRKYLGLAPRNRERFFKITTKYIMRETAASVKLPLPEKKEEKIEVDIKKWRSNQVFVKEYNETLDLLEEEITRAEPNSADILGYMSQLRRLTGMMKVMSVAEIATEFLKNNPSEKLTIGTHHVTVRQWLSKLLASFGAVTMSDEAPEIKDSIEKLFRENEATRVLVASTISAGHGRNLQFCRNAVLAERMWNRKYEEQFFGRFHRIIKNADGTVKTEFSDADTVHCITINATQTFDEFFDKMVELKGEICDSADEREEDAPDSDFMKYLAREMVKFRIKWIGA